MNILNHFILGAGLSMDSFAVSVASGLCKKSSNIKNAFIIATFLAVFQGGMPVIGWLLGIGFSEYIETIDHWAAFVLLGFIGGKMIYEDLSPGKTNRIVKINFKYLVTISVATSIDALAVGVTFSFLNQSIIVPIIIIAITTFIFSFVGYNLSRVFHRKNAKFNMIGGIILIGIGTKILIEHLFFH